MFKVRRLGIIFGVEYVWMIVRMSLMLSLFCWIMEIDLIIGKGKE